MHFAAALVPSGMTELLASPAAARLGWVCIHSLWQAAAVAAALAVALRLIPRQSAGTLAARHRLAATALAALPAAAVVTFFLVPVASPAAAPLPARADTAASTLATPTAAATAAATTPRFVLLPAAPLGAPQPTRPDHLDRLTAWLPLVALAWTVGAALAAIRMACGVWITRRLVARATSDSSRQLQHRVDHWRRIMRIDAAVRILASAAVETPVVVGWLKPVILWPAAALVGMPAHELDAVLAHELAHVRRRDTLMNLLQACIDVLFFHHPAAWWISRQLREEREHCADDLAVKALEADRAGTRLSYARALLALEQRRQSAALAVAANGGRLLDRIRRLAGDDTRPTGSTRLLAAGLTAAALVAIVLSMATPRPAMANELPKDTNTIESLTVEQAQKLAEEFPGVDVQIEIKGYGKLEVRACLPMNGLKSLDAETAKALAGYGKGPLLLNGLTTLDADAAKALAEFKGYLSLNGLTRLDVDTAKALAEFVNGGRCLNGLTRLDVDTAKALAEFKGLVLSLEGLTRLDVDTAKALAEFESGTLCLDGLTSLDATIAKALAEVKGAALYLDGLTTLDADTAKALAGFRGYLSLNGLIRLDVDTVKALAKFRNGRLRLNGLTRLDATIAKALAEVKFHTLHLDGLTTLDAATAKALAEFNGHVLSLNGLTTLDADTAKALATVEAWDGDLPNITTFDTPDSVAIAKALATCKGPLSLPNLKKISPKTLSALIAKEAVEIPLIETLSLIPEPDGGATKDVVIPK